MTQWYKRPRPRARHFRAAGLGLALATAPLAALGQTPASTTAAVAPAFHQQNFASAEDAVAALVKALQTDDTKSLLDILGPGGEKLVSSGDKVADNTARQNFLAAYAASHTLTAQPDGSDILVIGENAWPLPIPVVQVDGRWQFDATTGAQEIVDRTIGRNELRTIQTLLSAVAAEEDYFDRMKAANGTGAYAERLFSTAGKHDGLYWDVQAGTEESPLGPLIAQAEDEGYPGATAHDGKQTPYHGYYFHILKAQGAEAPDGAKQYIKGGKMTEGFAFVAWPAKYGSSGIMTFVVDQDGIIFQNDLGADTAKLAAAMTLFNPGLDWTQVDIGK